MYQTVEQLDAWSKLQDPRILKQLSELNPQHSGYSFSLAISAMRHIHEHGFDDFYEKYKRNFA